MRSPSIRMSKTGVASTSHAQELFVLSCFGCFALLSVVCHLLGSCRYSMEACSRWCVFKFLRVYPRAFFLFCDTCRRLPTLRMKKAFCSFLFVTFKIFTSIFILAKRVVAYQRCASGRFFYSFSFVTFNLLIDSMLLLAKPTVVYQRIASGLSLIHI